MCAGNKLKISKIRVILDRKIVLPLPRTIWVKKTTGRSKNCIRIYPYPDKTRVGVNFIEEEARLCLRKGEVTKVRESLHVAIKVYWSKKRRKNISFTPNEKERKGLGCE